MPWEVTVSCTECGHAVIRAAGKEGDPPPGFHYRSTGVYVAGVPMEDVPKECTKCGGAFTNGSLVDPKPRGLAFHVTGGGKVVGVKFGD